MVELLQWPVYNVDCPYCLRRQRITLTPAILSSRRVTCKNCGKKARLMINVFVLKNSIARENDLI